MTTPPDATSMRGLSRAIARLRQPRAGLFEILIAVAVILMLIAGFFSLSYVIGEELRSGARDAQAMKDRAKLEQIALDTRDLLAELRAAIAAAGPAQKRALDELIARINALLEKQTTVIVRNQDQSPSVRTVVVVVTPEPQPTATVTCRPNVVTGKCRT